MRPGIIAAVAAALLATVTSCAAAGFEQIMIPDPGSPPLQLSIWYPSRATPSPQTAGPYTQVVSTGTPIASGHHPLIVLSHGSTGSPFNHHDLAIALADAGFVVAAPLHTGDNYADGSDAGFRRDFVARPRHLERAIAYVTTAWRGRASVDPAHIGVFGFSLGGLTALTLAGGTPDLLRLVQRCADHPDSVECVFVRASHGDQLDPDPPAVTWTHEPRISAVVVAAPAVTLLFGPGDLAKVHAPVQLWRAEADTNVPDAYDTGPLRTLLVPMPEEHVVPKAGHFVFQAPCSPAFAAQASAICNDSPGVDRAAFHKEFDRKVTAFFRRHLMAR